MTKNDWYEVTKMNGRFKQSVVVFVQKGDNETRSNKMLTITHLKKIIMISRLFAKNEKKMIVDLLKRGGGGQGSIMQSPITAFKSA